MIERYNLKVDRQLTKLKKQFETYFAGLGGLVESMNLYAAAASSGDRQAASHSKSQIGRHRNKALLAARQIRRSDRSLLARRVTVADEILERLEKDKELLGDVSHRLTTDTVEGFDEAAKSINEVLERWRELLRF